MEYTYLIVNSDATCSLKLRKYLEDYPELQFAGRCLTSIDGVNSVLKLLPDIVFLHLDDQDFDGFEILTELYQFITELPQIIAISKTKRFAYEAIKHNCFDYWLMPCHEFEVRKSLMRLKRIASSSTQPKKLCLKSYRDYHYVDTDDIMYLKADNNATDVFMANGTKISTYKSLKKFEQQLPSNFVRVHQSYMLNTNHVERINYGKAICSLKGQNLLLPFSKTYRKNVDGLKTKLSKNSISTLL